MLTLPWETIGPSGVAAIVFVSVFWLISTGRLVPRRTVDEWKEFYQKRVEDADKRATDASKDRDHWRATAEVTEKARADLSGQIGVIVDFFRPVLKASRDDSEDVRP